MKEANKALHVTLQIEGFLASFVIGFMMTAIPRFIGAGPATLGEVALACLCEIAVMTLAISGHAGPAQIPFFVLLCATLVFVGRRVPARTKSPPASFLLIPFGFLNALVGSTLMGMGITSGNANLPSRGQEMLQTGFLLCLVLGIAGYLAPFLTGYAADPAKNPSMSPLRSMNKGSMVFHAFTGALIFGSFLLPTRDFRATLFVRAIAATAHFLAFGRIYLFPLKKAAHALFFWIACWMVVLGLWATALWPDNHIAMEHIMFIGGFSLMIFSFGSLIVLTHSAQASLLNGKLITLKVVGFLVLTAMALRVTADLDAWNYKRWIHFASGFWWLAALVWLIYILPKLWRVPAVEFNH